MLLTQLDMPVARYVCFANERDLSHIETDRKGGYIEFAVRQIYRAERLGFPEAKNELWGFAA